MDFQAWLWLMYLSTIISTFVERHYAQFRGCQTNQEFAIHLHWQSKQWLCMYNANRRNQQLICMKNCKFCTVNLSPPVIEYRDEDTFKNTFHFPKDVKSTFQYLLNGSLSMVAEIGGYLGLLLGFSCLDITVIFNNVLDRFH